MAKIELMQLKWQTNTKCLQGSGRKVRRVSTQGLYQVRKRKQEQILKYKKNPRDKNQ